MQSLPISEQPLTTRLTISPETPFLTGQMPEEGISLSNSPFIVGRLSKKILAKNGTGNASALHNQDRGINDNTNFPQNMPQVHLELVDNKPYCLSRLHFLIQLMPNDQYIVRDLCSSIGTRVNGRHIGRQAHSFVAPLDSGDNIISIGSDGSPFRFRATVAPKNDLIHKPDCIDGVHIVDHPDL